MKTKWETYAETVPVDDPKGWSVRSTVDLHYKICQRCTRTDAQRIVDALNAEIAAAPELLEALQTTARVLDEANERGEFRDTLWASETETLFDFIDNAIAKSGGTL